MNELFLHEDTRQQLATTKTLDNDIVSTAKSGDINSKSTPTINTNNTNSSKYDTFSPRKRDIDETDEDEDAETTGENAKRATTNKLFKSGMSHHSSNLMTTRSNSASSLSNISDASYNNLNEDNDSTHVTQNDEISHTTQHDDQIYRHNGNGNECSDVFFEKIFNTASEPSALFFCVCCRTQFASNDEFVRHCGLAHANFKLSKEQEQFLGSNLVIHKCGSAANKIIVFLMERRMKAKFLGEYAHDLLVANEETALCLEKLNKDASCKKRAVHEQANNDDYDEDKVLDDENKSENDADSDDLGS